MRIIGLVLLWSTLCFSAFAESLRGYIYVENGRYWFIDSETMELIPMRGKTQEVQQALSRLKSYDSLTGTGTYNAENDLVVETVDFVALNRLIGTWQSEKGRFNFVNYTRVDHVQTESTSQYQYALSPCSDEAWCIYLSSDSTVVLGSLYLDDSRAEIELYDSNTGEITQTYNLKKIEE